MAIDRERIADEVFVRELTGIEPTEMIVGSSWSTYPEFAVHPEQDVERAKRLLMEAKERAGFEDGRVTLTISVLANHHLVEQAMLSVIEDWAQIGIDANLRVTDLDGLQEWGNKSEIIARAFYLPEWEVWTRKIGNLVPPYSDSRVDYSVYNGVACDGDIQHTIKTVENWHRFGEYDRLGAFRSDVYLDHVRSILSDHSRFRFAVGMVSDLPLMVFMLREVIRCDQPDDQSSPAHLVGGDLHCPG